MNSILVIFIFFILYSCSIVDFAEGVNKDTQNLNLQSREDLYSTGFTGVVQDKIHLQKRDSYKYRLNIKILQLADSIFITSFVTSSQYNYDGATCLLNLSVSENCFNHVNIKDTVIKKHNDDSMIINNKKYLLINKE